MSRKHVLQGAQNVNISGGTFIAADSVKYYAGAGDRATSDAPIPENQTQAFGSLAGPTFSQN
ncbi:hypothetical protein K443DRAFT_4032 [Laccaria amethystina LaAM-08-1]|uniref:Uncharacterized protein n=1 Tax=Laccaria amethystina LaAM-08-1 TaxID=1095629 RepID=A0A0C9XU35_9AGAR|nr:hypothetical protein K443DRAFT_4032 [Laccaria amethystina LaAM-08-1]